MDRQISRSHAGDAERQERSRKLLWLMERYVNAYVNAHQIDVMAEIMHPEYRLEIGRKLVWIGYETDYRAGVKMAFETFPKMVLTVNELITNGDRLAMAYTEHARPNGRVNSAAWDCVGLYKWDGNLLTENGTEQDGFSRDRQLESGAGKPLRPPAVSPWDTPAEEPNPEAEAIVRAWMRTGAWTTTKGVFVDDEWAGEFAPRIIDQETIEERDLFSAGDAVAFRIAQHGKLLPDFAPTPEQAGRAAMITIAGIVHVGNGVVTRGTLCRDRQSLYDELKAG